MEDPPFQNLPIEKASISGPTLASLLNYFTSSPNNLTGLLFGHLTLLSPPPLSDDIPSTTSLSPSLLAVITSFTTSPTTSHHRHLRLLGRFSARRLSPLRPSLTESTHSHSLSSTPSLLLLITNPTPTPTPTPTPSPIHTLDYKTFLFSPHSLSFTPLPLHVINIGPAFRGHYGHFTPSSSLPSLPCDHHLPLGSPMREDKDHLADLKKVADDQKDLDLYALGFGLGELSRLVGSDAFSYTKGVEDLYEKMLAKLDSLAKHVDSSSARVLEQENHNMKLRYRVAGIE